jgi:hypothetical protein
VIYVCSSVEIADRVNVAGAAAGLSDAAGTIRVELLDTIRQQAITARDDTAEAA